jgi:hypothetical protein
MINFNYLVIYIFKLFIDRYLFIVLLIFDIFSY